MHSTALAAIAGIRLAAFPLGGHPLPRAGAMSQRGDAVHLSRASK
jgi:hypothetical protein